MSQILDAINKADAERNHRDASKLSHQDTLASLVYASDRAFPRKRVWLFSLFAVIAATCVGFSWMLIYESTKSMPLNFSSDTRDERVITRAKQPEPQTSTATPMILTKQNPVSVNNAALLTVKKALIHSSTVTPARVTRTANYELPEAVASPDVDLELPQYVKPVSTKDATAKKRSLKKSEPKIDAPESSIADIKDTGIVSPLTSRPGARSKRMFVINVLMYDDMPSNRFVIINGARLITGAQIPGSDYRIRSIRKNGVIVENASGTLFVSVR